MAAKTASIIVDWGTTSLRATLVDADGQELDSLETAQGISALKTGEHENTLMAALLDFQSTAPFPLPQSA